jgi:branched-chain amino acid transport system substrate-binding protein
MKTGKVLRMLGWVAAFAFGGASAGEVVVGMTLPSTGSLAAQSARIREGVMAYVKAANRAGGIQGNTLVLREFDNQLRPEKAADDVKKLVSEHKVIAITSVLNGNVIQKAAQQASQLGVPVVGVYSGSGAFRGEGYDIITHVRGNFDAEMQAVARIYTTAGMRRFGVFEPDDPVGKAAAASFTHALKAHGLAPVAQVAFDREARNFAPYAEAMERAAPAVVVVFAPTGLTIRLIRALKERGSRALIVGHSAIDDREVYAQLGERSRGIAFSAVVPNPYDTNVALAREYRAAMKDAGFQAVSLSGMEAYANMKVLGEALRRSGPAPDRAALRKALAFGAPVELGGVTLANAAGGPGQGLSSIDVFMLTHDGRLLR